jgi:hypothetical protein
MSTMRGGRISPVGARISPVGARTSTIRPATTMLGLFGLFNNLTIYPFKIIA